MLINKIIRTNIYLLISAIFMCTTTALSAQNSITAALNSSKPGMTDIALPVGDKEHPTFLPVTVVKGSAQGPTFTIIAGIHGYEYPPIIAVQEVLKEIDPTRLTGNLIIVPIANVASFYARTPFIHPHDGLNLNTVFPGRADGSVTERIAHIITRDIIPLSDVFLDIHAGDASEDLMPFVCYYDNTANPATTALADRLCRISGFPNIVSYPYTLAPGQPALYAFKQAVQDGKTALSIESGKLGNVQQEAVVQTRVAIYNMLNEMGMYAASAGEQAAAAVPYNFYNRQSYIKSTSQGIFYSNYSAGDTVSVGDTIGYVTDVFGNKLHDITATASGVILYKIGTPPVNPGETMVCIGYRE